MNDLNADSEFSLLYPTKSDRPGVANRWGENAVDDMGLEQLAWTLSIDNKYHDAIKLILLELCTDINTITYRQEILDDFLKKPALSGGLREQLPVLAKLKRYAETGAQKIPLQETLSRLTELNTYITCVRNLQHILAQEGSSAHSQGLARLSLLLEEVAQDPTFLSLEKGLPDLLAKLNTIPSITIGINLNTELVPVEATLLAIHDKPFKGGTYFDRLLGRKTGRKPDQGIGPMHEVPHKHISGIDARVVKLQDRYDPMLVPLFRDLYEILRTVLAPVAVELKQYAQVNARLLIQLEAEIAYYLGAAALIQQMQAAGLPMCRPQADPIDLRSGHIQGIYNLILALSLADADIETVARKIVLNEVDFGPAGRIFILTGPNQGGKTVYTQAVGLSQVLFQAGLYIPAQAARLSPVDGIFTHFSRLEKTDSGTGRLAEEAERLNNIFHSITDKSLVLLNESLSSTSPGESLYLARDIVHALRLFGVRAIYATHLHELAEGLDSVNAEVKGDSRVVSLVAGVAMAGDKKEAGNDNVVYTYEIKPGPPRGLSYAKGIAVRYGISFEQLQEQWRERQKSGKDQPEGG
jgi:DNA mismatch repair ATPase MutS